MTVIQIKRRRDITNVRIFAVYRLAKMKNLKFRVYGDYNRDGEFRIFADFWPLPQKG